MSEEREHPDQPEEQPQPQELPPEQTPQPQEQPPPPAAAEEPPRQDWRDRRIGEQQQRLRERNARIQELEALVTQYQQGANPPQPGYQAQPAPQANQQPYQSPNFSYEQYQQAVEAGIQERDFFRRCNEVAEQGRRSYQDFDHRVQRLNGIVDQTNNQEKAKFNKFLDAALRTGQAARLVYDLGGDLNEASRIIAMDEIGMSQELTKIAMRGGTAASNAPRPLNPVASAAQSNRTMVQPDDPETADTLDTSEWMRRRMEQMSTRRQRTLG